MTDTSKAGTKPATATPASPAGTDKDPIVAKTADAVEGKSGLYVVAPGRTVVGDDGKDVGPGDKVKLTADEATSLLQRGFILDKDGSVVIQADGPAVNVDEGVEIAPAA